MLDDTVPLPAIEIATTQSRSDFSTIRELGRDAWGRILLAWRGNTQASSGQEPPVVLLERSALDVETARRMTDFHLYHARLLAPRAVVQREGDIHWLVVEAPANYEAPFEAIGDGGRLEVRSALKAGWALPMRSRTFTPMALRTGTSIQWRSWFTMVAPTSVVSNAARSSKQLMIRVWPSTLPT